MTLKDFLELYGSVLLEQTEQIQPLYDSSKEDAWESAMRRKLEKLERSPFAKQTEAILALTKGFLVAKRKGLFLVAEMGTGKTIMGIATAFLVCPEKSRTLILCPTHLVQKWIREIQMTVPNAIVVNLNGQGLAELIKLRGTKPRGREFYILGKEQAKLHFTRAAGTMVRQGREHHCPRCGCRVDDPNPRSRKDFCHICQEPLWQADKGKFRRYSKAEFIKRYLNGAFDFFIGDEVHQYKSGDSAQGQAFANLCSIADYTLCLTGTLMGGYSSGLYYLLWRANPRAMQELVGDYSRLRIFTERYGVTEQIIKERSEYGRASISKSRSVTVRERPGINPLLFTDILLEHSVFMRLEDVALALPPYQEKVIAVEMEETQQAEYKRLESSLMDAVRNAVAHGDRSLLGTMLQALLAYPDGARKGEIVVHPRTGEEIASAAELTLETLPKEDELLKIVGEEVKAGRKVMVCLEHTGTRNLIPDLQERLQKNGYSVVALRSTTTTPEKREAWVKTQVEKVNPDVLITNPRLVETGLDLLEFPTIVFFQTGYSTFTLRQTSRRSWRIGQTLPVRVYYMCYANTLQAKALQLMATKMQVALMVEGDLSDKGLTALAEGESSMLVQLAKSLLGEDDEQQTLEDAWDKYHAATAVANARLWEKESSEKAETAQEEQQPRSNVVPFRRVLRGKLFVRKGYAVAYVDGRKFHFQQGKIFYNGKVVGCYDSTLRGEIGRKPIELRGDGNGNYLLYELRSETELLQQSA